ncbi:ABC transporter permease [Halobacillus sp. A1]|uniref:ABC transporter permease n=1 Tax=Halobacillus sp. A1 TaxID=2880262 RepID=UPI0020A6790A|nr:ABC transporter permease subunit [Halobacillus sp. A1]MCP3029852.1 ABC transporter permease [Halobacillus sp. A1]
MWAICFRECKDLFKGFKPVLIISILLGMAMVSTRLGAAFPDEIEGVTQKEMYTSGLTLTITLFGILFVFALSHSVMNKEIESKTIRFLVTKTSRDRILLGKFMGTVLFWLIIIGTCFAFITLTSRMIHLTNYIEIMIFLLYSISAAFLLSNTVPKSNQSMFIGLILALAIPGLSLWAYFSERWYVMWLKYVTPYYYTDLAFPLQGVPLLFAALFIALSLYLFKRRDF